MRPKILSSLVLVLLTTSLIAQPVDSATGAARQKQYDYYRDKQHSNRTTGWILLGAGAAATAGSAAIILADIGSDYIGDATGELLLFGAGIGSMLTSIPFFISAGSNQRKARLALKGEKVSFGTKPLPGTSYAAFTLTLPL